MKAEKIMLKILVCVKEIADPQLPLEINSEGNWLRPCSSAGFRMNTYDEYALEEAVLIRESCPGAEVHVLSLGPERVAATLKKAIEKGADYACHILMDGDAYHGSHETASIIAEFAAPRSYDLILTGVMSEDLMQGSTGPMIAALLGIPFGFSVIRQSLINNRSTIKIESEIEGGVKALFELKLPALLAIQSGINRPRYPSLSNKLRAQGQKIVQFDVRLPGSLICRERINSISSPEIINKGTIISGSREEKAVKLVDILHEKSFI